MERGDDVMAKQKSYNKDALRGMNVDDKEWQADVHKGTGIMVPDDMLYKPDGPRFLMKEIRKRNVEDMMNNLGLPEKEAKMKAEPMYKAAMKGYDKLLNGK